MNLKIYKTTTQYSIDYFIVDSDQPDYGSVFVTRNRDESRFRINSRCGPIDIENKAETSFLDLLAVTGITNDQIEYIFRNINFDKYELSITPRYMIRNGGLSGVTGCSASWSGLPGAPTIYGSKITL